MSFDPLLDRSVGTTVWSVPKSAYIAVHDIHARVTRLLSSVRDFGAIRSRVKQTLEKGVQIDLSTESCTKYLRRHVNCKVNTIVLYVDIDGSTRMSKSLAPADFASILHIFSQEMSLAISELGGYTLKYVGDAVIGLFPAQFNMQRACRNAVDCAGFMHDVVIRGINPELTAHGLPELRIKISIDYGEVQVVLYGKSLERSHIDIVGYSISAAAKMISFAQGGQTIVGEKIFDSVIDSIPADRFSKLDADTSKWSYEEGKGSYTLYLLRQDSVKE